MTNDELKARNINFEGPPMFPCLHRSLMVDSMPYPARNPHNILKTNEKMKPIIFSLLYMKILSRHRVCLSVSIQNHSIFVCI